MPFFTWLFLFFFLMPVFFFSLAFLFHLLLPFEFSKVGFPKLHPQVVGNEIHMKVQFLISVSFVVVIRKHIWRRYCICSL